MTNPIHGKGKGVAMDSGFCVTAGILELHRCGVFGQALFKRQGQSRFAVTIFTYHKNGGILPVTKGKPGNYQLPLGEKSVYQQRFFTVKLHFQYEASRSKSDPQRYF